MPSVVGAIIAIFFVVRMLLNARAGRPTRVNINVPLHIVLWWALFGPASLLIIPLMARGPIWIAGGVFALAVWMGLPIAHLIMVRLGLWRAAMTFAFLGSIPFRADIWGDAVIAGARACIVVRRRSGGVPVKALTALTTRINSAHPLTGGYIVGAGLLAVAQGDRDRGRNLLASVASFPRTGRYARRLAIRWLVADAASRGDWPRLIKLRFEFSDRLTRLIGAIGARLTHASDYVPSNRKLWWYWLCSPARLSTYGLLRKALDHVPQAATAAADTPLFARHVAALKNGASDDALVQLASDWDKARDALPYEAQSAIADDLRALAKDRPNLASRHPAFGTMGHAGDAQSELEAAITALRYRHEDGRNVPSIEEWAELVMLRDLFSRASTNAPNQQLAYSTAHLLIGNHAVHLQNDRAEKLMASAIYSWLELESKLAGDDAFVAHYKRNVASCGV